MAVQQSLVGLTSSGKVPRLPDRRQLELERVESDIDQVSARMERARLEGDSATTSTLRGELKRLGSLRGRLRWRR